MTVSNKPPAFQFYPQDYLASSRVAEMTLEEEGAYIRLLCYCWSIGSIPSDPERCAKLAGKGCTIETATNVQRAFNERSTDGQRLLHDRLEKERENQKRRREFASKAGKKSAEKRSANAINSDCETTKNDRSTTVQRKSNSSSSSSDEDVLKKPKRKRASVTVVEDQSFDEFWSIYPRHTDKAVSRKAWAIALTKVDSETILVATERFKNQCLGKDQKYIPHPSTWLNKERWADDGLKPKDPFAYLSLPDDEREAFVKREMYSP